MKLVLSSIALLMIMTLHAQELSVMSYNIKLDYPKEGENSWTSRKQFLIGQIEFYEPDVMGVQEAMPNQMKDMDSLLVNYDFIGVGRDDGKEEGEYSAIFYKKNKYKVLTSSTFWLSETPEKVSMGWDAVCNRICTYGLFQSKGTKQKFWVFNTHFDHVGGLSRKNSAKLIIQKIKTINTNRLPVVLMGDFNMEPESETIQYIKKHLKDSKEVSLSEPFGPSGTFNGFQFQEPVTRRIDYIFVHDKIKVKKYTVLSDNRECKYPSDHLPVYAVIQF